MLVSPILADVGRLERWPMASPSEAEQLCFNKIKEPFSTRYTASSMYCKAMMEVLCGNSDVSFA